MSATITSKQLAPLGQTVPYYSIVYVTLGLTTRARPTISIEINSTIIASIQINSTNFATKLNW